LSNGRDNGASGEAGADDVESGNEELSGVLGGPPSFASGSAIRTCKAYIGSTLATTRSTSSLLLNESSASGVIPSLHHSQILVSMSRLLNTKDNANWGVSNYSKIVIICFC